MHLTIFTDYTLRVLIYLGAKRNDERLATIGDIAAAYRISENHLMKVVHHLARNGYAETTRGKGGGMRLARSPDLINLGAVVRSTEEHFALVECFREGGSSCPIVPFCALQGIFENALLAFFAVLDGKTLADLLPPRRRLIKVLNGSARSTAAGPASPQKLRSRRPV